MTRDTRQFLENSNAIFENRVALATGAGAEPFLQTHRGYYYATFEQSIFTPCGQKEGWSVGFASNAISTQFKSSSLDGSWMVTFKGMLSHEGRFGPMGGSSRAFIVTEVIESKPALADTCD